VSGLNERITGHLMNNPHRTKDPFCPPITWTAIVVIYSLWSRP